jgi:single-stranded DNA-binding protein
VYLEGRLVSDARMTEANGRQKCEFTLSVPGLWGKRERFEVVLFDNMATMHSGLLEKGAAVAVSGHLHQTTRRHEDLWFTDTYFVVDDIQYSDTPFVEK